MKLVINAADFGLTASTQLQTEAIQKAIDHCFLQGGGIVEIPEGEYRTGDIRLRSNITLHLMKNAKLIGSNNPEDYFNYLSDKTEPLDKSQITDAPYIHLSTIHGETGYVENKPEYRFKRIAGSRWNNAIIRAFDAENIKIIGEEGSLIDGVNCFDDYYSEEDYRGPHGMTFYGCRNIELSGYTIQNTGNWAHNLLFCENISVDSIKVLAGHDGFDASVCTNIKITNSEFYTGDDCIAGFGNINTLVSDSILNSSCSALRFGGSNVIIRNCHMYGPGRYCFRGSMTDEEKRASAPSPSSGARNNMLSAFTYYADYSLPIEAQPGNILITDCCIDMADRFLHYNYSGNETWQKNRPLDSIEFRNIDAKGVSMPITAYGDEDVPVTLRLTDINLSLREGFASIDIIHACNYKSIELKNINISNFSGDCLVRKWSEGNISLDNICGTGKASVKKADFEFFSESI